MADELAYILINPYTIAKSRTGGVIARFMSRTGLEPVAARMFVPSRELIERYIALVDGFASLDDTVKKLFCDYLRKSYMPNAASKKPMRVMMLLMKGENAVRKIAEVAGPATMSGGETVRDTYGDYVVDEKKRVHYFEPAVFVGETIEETGAVLKLWCEYSEECGGWAQCAADVSKEPGWERTLVLIKPDNFLFPTARPGNIIDVLSRSGLRIIAAKIHRMSVNQAMNFYAPVRFALREKLKKDTGEKAAAAMGERLKIAVPDDLRDLLGERLGPAIGDEQFYELIKFMTGCCPRSCTEKEKNSDGINKCFALVYGGMNAIKNIRGLVGPTDPSKAPSGSVRREFGHDIMVNAAHASDSVENAEREIGIINMDEDLITPLVRTFYT